MHPAFSVIFFTTLSGMGYGLWFFIGCRTLFAGPDYAQQSPVGLITGFALVSVGLLSSTLHLGKPLRAWRAFSQWRSSWLSREGVFSMVCFVPALIWLGQLLFHREIISFPVVAGFLLVLSIATIICTAMIYASLKPIPAWRHDYVVPVYLLFAMLTGGLSGAAMDSFGPYPISEYFIFGFILLAVFLAVLKKRYWQAIDSQSLPSRASALGLKPELVVTVFERPHTEANYLTREMGFVLARKHSKKLRSISLLLFCWLPVFLCIASWMLPYGFSGYLVLSAALFAYLGATVERWLFFAEARHAVMQYY